MKKIARLDDKTRHDLFRETANSLSLSPEIIEKDFWVCFMLNHLFHECKYKDAFVFKGGTSLSKSYHKIKRFSEDIDLILDWREIVNDNNNPWLNRSRTQQDKYNKALNKEAAEFYKDVLVPILNNELEETLGKGHWVYVEPTDEMVIDFRYPRLFETDYIIPTVRLEIGPLAEWTPNHITSIEPFCYDEGMNLFEQGSTDVLTIDAERTFWEKISILHKIANFPKDKIVPRRYSRHLYDVYCLGNSEIKNSAFERKELLEKDVIFKQKFYYSQYAHYETATLQNIQLLPSQEHMKALRNDYREMQNMIYGDRPTFDEILDYLKVLEKEIHELA